MRIFYALLLAVITCVLVYTLDHPLGPLPALGRLVDPINGCWANAEPVNKDFNGDLHFPEMQGEATIWIDSQMIPHIHAANEHDLYFMEGYLHAGNRLWQMDMETRAAAGRVSEVVGEKAFNFDRKQRRKGMVFAAENSLKAMEADPRTLQMIKAYTEGINAYIAKLSYKDYPLEYKLMGFEPEKWTNLKSSLLLKYMADDLTGSSDDIALTYLRDVLPPQDFSLLFPEKVPGSSPVIPIGTVFEKPSLQVPTAPTDSLVFPHYKSTDFGEPREDGKGSNNWVVSGSRTASGAPILCNDPHLGLNLPSLWYVIQLQAPGINVYGVSLPGTPGIVIGFNDSLSWGFTNNYRDVKDFYEIKPVSQNPDKYWFAGQQLNYNKRLEKIGIKGKPDFVDTVNYTIHGPLMYDGNYKSKDGLQKPLAMCWMAHRATNELLAIYLMNKAQNYDQFVDAILNFQCPAQNIAYADRAGNIAIWGQGQFVNKWKEQGRFVMEGYDSATLWKELIPMRENPHVLNPQQGFVCSANQSVTDSAYPYWYNGDFVELRAWRINQLLNSMQKATVQDMFTMQNDTHSLLAQVALPIMLKQVKRINDQFLMGLESWDYNLNAESKYATLFQLWWKSLYREMWNQPELAHVPDELRPLTEVTMQLIRYNYLLSNALNDTSVNPKLNAVILKSYQSAVDSFMKITHSDPTSKNGEWFNYKNTSVSHLTKLPAFSFDHLKIGGWGNTINAAKTDHGPSWRMVVQMGKEIEAYGVYPGGQSGNPGSKYYADFLNNWVEGKYYRLMFLPNSPNQNDSLIKYTVKSSK